MMVSLDDYLRVVAPSVPSALLSQTALASIGSIARGLPPCGLIGFESALHTANATADFAVGLLKDSGSSQEFGRHGDDWRSTRKLDTPDWARLREFVSVWANPASELYANAGTVWLEWDVGDGNAPVAAPNVLLGVTGDRTKRLAEDGLRRLLGRPLSPATRIQLARCYDVLPSPAGVFQVGAMLARQVDGVRVCIYPVRMQQTLTFLERVGWPGALAELERTLAPFEAFPVTMALDVDVGAGVSPKVGIECYLDERRRADLDPRWSTFLQYLVDRGLCTVEKQAALLAWPGRQTSSSFVWPCMFVRGLNHIKLVYMPGRPLAAKAYWGFTHRWATVAVPSELAQA